MEENDCSSLPVSKAKTFLSCFISGWNSVWFQIYWKDKYRHKFPYYVWSLKRLLHLFLLIGSSSRLFIVSSQGTKKSALFKDLSNILSNLVIPTPTYIYIFELLFMCIPLYISFWLSSSYIATWYDCLIVFSLSFFHFITK